mgnify:CR=1 FL=1
MPLCMLCALCFASVHIDHLAILKVHLCWITQRAEDVLLVPLWVPSCWTMYVCDHVWREATEVVRIAVSGLAYHQ